MEGEERVILPWGPQTFKGPHETFTFMIFTFYGLFLYVSLSQHCRDSMSECSGRIIGNAFTVNVDKHFA